MKLTGGLQPISGLITSVALVKAAVNVQGHPLKPNCVGFRVWVSGICVPLEDLVTLMFPLSEGIWNLILNQSSHFVMQTSNVEAAAGFGVTSTFHKKTSYYFQPFA